MTGSFKHMEYQAMKRPLFTVIFVLLCGSLAAAQAEADLTLDEGVKAHSGVDAVYKDFSEGYRTLKPETVADLYTEDAAYLSPGDDVTTGRPAILENFTGFFERIRDRGQTMTIRFRILQRKIDKNMGYDVGIYTLNYYKDGESVSESQGKFVGVLVKGKDGKWRFQVDGYSDLKPRPKNN